jgi:chemotaxis response regulator CheB
MPKEAVKLGAVDHIVPLDAIPGLIESYGRKHL